MAPSACVVIFHQFLEDVIVRIGHVSNGRCEAKPPGSGAVLDEFRKKLEELKKKGSA